MFSPDLKFILLSVYSSVKYSSAPSCLAFLNSFPSTLIGLQVLTSFLTPTPNTGLPLSVLTNSTG